MIIIIIVEYTNYERRIHNIKLFLINSIRIAIIGIAIFAIFHIIYTIKTYDTILTALPLWMSVVIEVVFWFILILAGIIVYILLLKYKK